MRGCLYLVWIVYGEWGTRGRVIEGVVYIRFEKCMRALGGHRGHLLPALGCAKALYLLKPLGSFFHGNFL